MALSSYYKIKPYEENNWPYIIDYMGTISYPIISRTHTWNHTYVPRMGWMDLSDIIIRITNINN